LDGVGWLCMQPIWRDIPASVRRERTTKQGFALVR
jgi:hypothetical protein